MRNSPAPRSVKVSKAATKSVSSNNGSFKAKKSSVEHDLIPSLRDRILAELDSANVAEELRIHHLSSMTGRVFQTVRRWIASEKPGLPDLASFALLCQRFNSDANWMLGLVGRRYPLPVAPGTSETHLASEWEVTVRSQVNDLCDGYEVKSMVGDDMEPRIQDGAPIWIDTTVTEFRKNGIYFLEYHGKTLVRQIETRVGEGVLLSCENTRYKPTLFKDTNEAKRAGLKILGLVKLTVTVDQL